MSQGIQGGPAGGGCVPGSAGLGGGGLGGGGEGHAAETILHRIIESIPSPA